MTIMYKLGKFLTYSLVRALTFEQTIKEAIEKERLNSMEVLAKAAGINAVE